MAHTASPARTSLLPIAEIVSATDGACRTPQGARKLSDAYRARYTQSGRIDDRNIADKYDLLASAYGA